MLWNYLYDTCARIGITGGGYSGWLFMHCGTSNFQVPPIKTLYLCLLKEHV